MRSPVLLLVFNRPGTTRQAFEAIRAAKPSRLYVAADGPRPEREDDARRCEEVRHIATNVDWPCDLKTLFQTHNLGCKLGPVRGIDWFFEQEDEGIILEDDILPLPSFFPYSDELLERYRNDQRVGVICGSNLVAKRFPCHDSYFFSRYINISGWASWRRAWELYDIDMRAWPLWRDQGGLRSVSEGTRSFDSHWTNMFDLTFRGGVDWWDFQLFFACWYHGMLGALPAHNQIYNLGYGADATHTIKSPPAFVRESTPEPLLFPLKHPPRVERTPSADILISRNVHDLTFAGTLKRKLMKARRVVRRTPVLGDFLKGLQVRLGRITRLMFRDHL